MRLQTRCGVAGSAGSTGKQRESASERRDEWACNIEWDARPDPICTESARQFGGDEKCLLDEESDARERRSTGSRGLLLVSFASDGSRGCALSVTEARRRANDDGARHRGVGKGIHLGLGKRSEIFGRGGGEIVKGFVMIEHPARQRGFGALLNPLVDQRRDFALQVCGVVESSEFKTLQRRSRRSSQVVQRWNHTRN